MKKIYNNGSASISVSVSKEIKEAFMKKETRARNKILKAAIDNSIKILPDYYI